MRKQYFVLKCHNYNWILLIYSVCFNFSQVTKLAITAQALESQWGTLDQGPIYSGLRLPIFRRSISRKHDSLPSSPSSSNVRWCLVHSPSSTNSSSGGWVNAASSVHRPSAFTIRRSEPKQEPTNQNLSISNGAQPGQSSMQKLSLEEHTKARGRHSVGFSSSPEIKKITRSLTEDFEGEKEHSTNKNVFAIA